MEPSPSAELLYFPIKDGMDLDADLVLDNLKGELTGFVLAGYDKNGNEFFSSTFGHKKDVLWLIESLKQTLLADDSTEF